MTQHQKLLDNRFKEKASGGAGEETKTREDAVSEAMRCLLDDLSELSRAVEQLEQQSSEPTGAWRDPRYDALTRK